MAHPPSVLSLNNSSIGTNSPAVGSWRIIVTAMMGFPKSHRRLLSPSPYLWSQAPWSISSKITKPLLGMNFRASDSKSSTDRAFFAISITSANVSRPTWPRNLAMTSSMFVETFRTTRAPANVRTSRLCPVDFVVSDIECFLPETMLYLQHHEQVLSRQVVLRAIQDFR